MDIVRTGLLVIAHRYDNGPAIISLKGCVIPYEVVLSTSCPPNGNPNLAYTCRCIAVVHINAKLAIPKVLDRNLGVPRPFDQPEVVCNTRSISNTKLLQLSIIA